MAKREMKATRRRSRGKRKKRDHTIRMNIQDMMKKKVATKKKNMMKPSHIKNIMNLPRRRRKASMVTKNSTRRDLRPLATTRRPTRTNIIKNINSTMTSTKKANIR